MKRFLIVEDNGQGMEDVYSLLRERGYSVTECGPESGDTLLFNQFAMDLACVQAFWITHDQRIIYVNDAACRTLGYTSEELTRMFVGDIDPGFPGPDHSDFFEHWRELKENGFVKFETSHRARDGRVYPVEIQSNFLEFNGREYNCCYVTDISDRKLAEEKLLLQQFCIKNTEIGIFQTSVEGEILLANDAACQSLGYSFEELRKLSVSDIDPAITRGKILEISDMLDAHGSATHETVHRRKDGTIFPVEITANKLDFHGNEYVFSFVKDITERKKAENA
jgi:two-component system, cell cycle sensor histidine kinase and response regulator CckA